MTKPTFAPGLDLDPAAPRPMPPVRRVGLGPIATLLRMSLDRMLRSRRIVAVALLFALPIALAVVARRSEAAASTFQEGEVEFALIFLFIPNALVPLTALLYASGMIQDEVEEQTLTYLLVRPVPRWSIYACKLLATLLVAGALVAIFTMATYAAIYWGAAPEVWASAFPGRALRAAALIDLALVAYASLFGLLGIFLRRTLVVGVGYIVVFEGVLANIDFVARRLTVMYSFRVLCERWLGLDRSEWGIDLATAPDASTCVWTLALASLVATALAAFAFTVREFRLKTPEGS